MDSWEYTSLEDLARSCEVDVEDVRAVAYVEVDLLDWDEDMERLTPNGVQVVVQHFQGGLDPDPTPRD